MTNHAREVHVGIDVSKGTLDVCVLLEGGDPDGESFTVENDHGGVDEILSRFGTSPPKLVVMEATGKYERLAATQIAAAGAPVSIVNPRQARDFAKAMGKLAKTDAIDAFVLARFAKAVEPDPTMTPDEGSLALQAILARRRQLIEMRTAEGNRLKMTSDKALRKRIKAHIEWLDKEIGRTDSDLDEAVEGSESFKARGSMLKSVPGVGRVLARTHAHQLKDLARTPPPWRAWILRYAERATGGSRMSTIPRVAKAMRHVLRNVADEAGRESGLIQRERKLTGAAFCQAAVFGWLANPEATRSERAQAAYACGAPISPQGLEERPRRRARRGVLEECSGGGDGRGGRFRLARGDTGLRALYGRSPLRWDGRGAA